MLTDKPVLVDRLPVLPARASTAHKGDFGRVAILAGSRGMSGAACLAGLACLRSGAGLTRVLAGVSCQPIVAGFEPGLMTQPLEEDADGRISFNARKAIDLAWPTVLAIGPGLGRSDELVRLLRELLECEAALVIDADGLNNLADATGGLASRRPRTTVLTPHPGEFRRLWDGAGLGPLTLDDDDASRLNAAHLYAQHSASVVVLKGHRSVVADGRRAYINTTGNPGMASGGMGDVLTGAVAALLAQRLEGFEAACLAVHAHGLAADRVARRIAPFGYLAREVADELPVALAQLSAPRMGFR